MATTQTLHHNAKELLLYIAMVLAAEGAIVLKDNVWVGLALMAAALVVVFARGLYKKFLGNGKSNGKSDAEPTV